MLNNGEANLSNLPIDPRLFSKMMADIYKTIKGIGNDYPEDSQGREACDRIFYAFKNKENMGWVGDWKDCA